MIITNTKTLSREPSSCDYAVVLNINPIVRDALQTLSNGATATSDLVSISIKVVTPAVLVVTLPSDDGIIFDDPEIETILNECQAEDAYKEACKKEEPAYHAKCREQNNWMAAFGAIMLITTGILYHLFGDHTLTRVGLGGAAAFCLPKAKDLFFDAWHQFHAKKKSDPSADLN